MTRPPRISPPRTRRPVLEPLEARVVLDAAVGAWGPVLDMHIVAVHLHVLPTGDVLYWDRYSEERVWDPVGGGIRLPADPGYDVFCSGHAYLPDGRLLVTGGHPHAGELDFDGVGLVEASVYDPYRDVWERLPDMNDRRWYPSNLPLPTGEQLVLSGSLDPAFTKNTLPQIWNPSTGAWRALPGATSEAAHGFELYPRLFTDPTDGRIFKAGQDNDTWYLDTSGEGSWVQGPYSDFGFRSYGLTVEYAPGKILLAGGGDPPLAAAEVIDLNEVDPAFRTVAPLNIPRRQANAVVLPDGRVLVVGGSAGEGFNNEDAPVLAAEVWDPATETATVVAEMQTPRMYHSVAALLPDGRVLVAGGGQGANAQFDYPTAEIYSPDYLFRGERPAISYVDPVAPYGDNFFIETPDAARITAVSLVALPSVTHTYDMNQRFLPLEFYTLDGGVVAAGPESALRAAPGPYMLFILDEAGVPSVASIVFVGAASLSENTGGAPSGGGVTPTPVQTETEQIVDATYAQLLGRPADAGGMAFWTAFLGPAPTAAARSLLAQVVLNTPEGRQMQLNRLYQQYLGRPADAGGLAFFAPLLTSGAATSDQAAAVLAGSEEFLTRAGGSAGFVDLVFRTVVGRPSAASDPRFVGNLADGAARTAYALRVLTTAEADRHEVVDYYARGLGLTVTTSDPGVAFWAGQLTAGRRSELVWADILSFLTPSRSP